jgi:hypothetical protein
LPCPRRFASVRGLMSRFARLFPLLPALWLVACSGTGEEVVSSPTSGQDIVAGNRIKSGEPGDDDSDKIEAKFGSHSPNMVDSKGKPMGEYKTATEFQKSNHQFKGGYEGKKFNVGEYRKKSWWGDRDYAKKVYGGDTDANGLVKRSRFEGDASNEGTKVARDNGRSYTTGDYATRASNEMGKKNIAKTSDAETDIRRDVFTDPEIMPYQQQNGMTMDEVKQRLGR